MAAAPSLRPIRPGIRFRVGISGHRVPPKLPKESEAPLRAMLDRVLATVMVAVRETGQAYAALSDPGASANATGPVTQFVIVSSVAEGSDRLVAEAGLAKGFTLETVLPFKRDEYARDFESDASKAQYQQMLGRASAVFELDGAPDARARAYEAAGLVMLANIDLLVAIWDGEEAAGIGGTAQIVGNAIAGNVPVIWIMPKSPGDMRLSWPASGEIPPATARPEERFRPATQAELAKIVAEIVAPPKQREALHSLRVYLRESERHWNFCPWYPLLMTLFTVRRLRQSDFQLAPALAASTAEWSGYLTTLPQDRSQRPAIENVLLPAFAAPDHLAVFYSLVYRSGYVFNFAFAALAVALALGGVFIHDPDAKTILVGAELVVIIAILGNWLLGHYRQWHRRWLEYRRLAETLRHLRIFAPMGSEGSAHRPSRGLDTEDDDWVNWYAWSLRRFLPLPNRVIDAEYLQKMRDAVLNAEVASQIKYHTANAERMAKLDHRLHVSGLLLFLATGAVSAAFLCLKWLGVLHTPSLGRDFILSLTTFLAALLPTLGAAIGAIHVQGDFKTVAEQSKRTKKRLEKMRDILASENPPIFARLADRVEKVSDIMMTDLIEWQTVFRTRPLSPPA